MVINNGVMSARFNNLWRNDDGQIIRDLGRYMFNKNQGELKVEFLKIECIRG